MTRYTKNASFVKNDKKRKFYSKGKKNFKRFKSTPKYVKDNLENKVAREKEHDVYNFVDSDDDYGADLGMGLEISDLPFLTETDDNDNKFVALTQDLVRPLFNTETTVEDEEAKLYEGLAELRYSAYRTNQKETVKRILQGRSTLLISSTGSGKSLCYQVPALLYWRYRKYMTLVVSPLISLMEDQIKNFPKCLKAVCLHSGYNKTQRRLSIEQLVNGEAQVAFISPEAIVSGALDLEDLKNLPPVGFVCIDEAHCLSEWSHNFRPAYMQFFKILNEKMNIKTFLGLTATATRATSNAIANQLAINQDNDVIGSTAIPDNLLLSVSYERNKETALINLLKSPSFITMPSIIIYCNRREETEKVAFRIRAAMQTYTLYIEKSNKSVNQDEDSNCDIENKPCESAKKEYKKLNWTAECYHAGLSKETRNRVQRQFIKGELRVVVATVAFGLGINKANVRAIIHYDMPACFENYVQEIGRAGRDGRIAQCHMFLKQDKSDLFYQQRNIYAATPDKQNAEKLVELLFNPTRCKCNKWLKKEELDHLDQLNLSDPHDIPDWRKANNVDVTNLGLDQHLKEVLLEEIEESSVIYEKENSSVLSNTCRSIVKRHRACQEGHEISLDIDKTAEEVNLKTESITTIIEQIQRAYPQLKIEQYTPIRPICKLFCYKGVEQMETLRKKCPLLDAALLRFKVDSKITATKGWLPKELTFNIVDASNIVRNGMTYKEAVRVIKSLELERVEETGKFRRSQAKARFEGNSLHLRVVGDLNDEERKEIVAFILRYTTLYEQIERAKISRFFDTMGRHCIDLDKMVEKKTRLDVSAKLKESINAYFDPPLGGEIEVLPFADVENSTDNTCKNQSLKEHSGRTTAKIELITKDVREFLDAHSSIRNAQVIARIFQGISTPAYSAEHWGANRKWWRSHLDIDFRKLVSIIVGEIVRIRSI